MTYNFLKKEFGTKKIDLIATIEIDNEIKDTCWVNDLGIVYTYGNKLGLLTKDGINHGCWKGGDGDIRNGDNPIFGSLSGVSYNQVAKKLFVCEDGGRDVRIIDLKNNYTSNSFRGVIKSSVLKMLKNVSMNSTVLLSHAVNENFFIAYPNLHKLFFYHRSSLYHIAGDGKCRFSIGNTLKNTSIGIPSGLVTYKDKVLMSDSFCGIVRMVDKKTSSIIAGHPAEDILVNPKKLALQKDTLYIMGGNGINTVLMRDNKMGNSLIYESKTLNSIITDELNGVYIIEGKDA